MGLTQQLMFTGVSLYRRRFVSFFCEVQLNIFDQKYYFAQILNYEFYFLYFVYIFTFRYLQRIKMILFLDTIFSFLSIPSCINSNKMHIQCKDNSKYFFKLSFLKKKQHNFRVLPTLEMKVLLGIFSFSQFEAIAEYPLNIFIYAKVPPVVFKTTRSYNNFKKRVCVILNCL